MGGDAGTGLDGMRTIGREPALRAVGAAYVAAGVVLPSLGPAVAHLRDELDLGGPLTAAHGAFFGIGLVLLGLRSGRLLVARHGASALARLALLAVLAGVVLVAVGTTPLVTLPGAAGIGCGFALVVLVLPPVVRAHPAAGAHAFADVNALFAVAAVLGPLALIGAELAGVSWRFAFGLAGGLAALAALVLARGVPLRTGEEAVEDAAPARLRRRRGFPAAVLVLLAGACVESTFAIWSATFVLEERGDAAVVATLMVLGFTVGQAIGRLSTRQVDRLVPERLAMPALFLTSLLGGSLLVVGPGPLARIAAGLLAGLGTSLLYPRAAGCLFDLAPDAGVAVSAAAALTSGLAIAIAPLVLGGISDAAGLTAAMALVPLLALVGLAVSLAAGSPRARSAV